MPENPNNIDSNHASEQLEALKSELMAIEVAFLVAIRLDLLKAVTRALEVSETARDDRGLFDRTFKEFPLGLIDYLERDALALWAAETQQRRLEAENKAAQTRPATALLEECRECRSNLLSGAKYTWRNDDVVKNLLADIQRGSSYVDLADDLNRLADLFKARWTYAGGRSEVTEAEVTRASELSTVLLKAVVTSMSEEVSKWADLRHRAWTNLHNNYAEIRAGASYIHRADPDHLAAYPSLYTNPRKKK